MISLEDATDLAVLMILVGVTVFFMSIT